jgi:hypothetical protein
MNLICNWCQSTHEISDNLVCMEGDPAHYICPSCLMIAVPLNQKSQKNINVATEGLEKRNSDRYPVFVPVRVSPQDRGVIVTSALVLDASKTGMCVQSKIHLKANDYLDLTLQGNNIKFHATGKVVYSENISVEDVNHYKAGIKLLDVFDEVE